MIISTRDPERLATWDAIFGLKHLPVKSPIPRLVCVREGELLAYDLDYARLPEFARMRYCLHIAQLTHQPYAAVRANPPDQVIPAPGCWVAHTPVLPPRQRRTARR